jgi:hypothetical protein
MKSFYQFLEEVDFAPTSTTADVAPVSAPTPYSFYARKLKPWKASKKETLKFWQTIAPSIPLALRPIEATHKGTTIQEDGIRITGSKEFITTVLSRLKDILMYESEKTKLVIDYRQNAKSLKPGGKDSYLFYLNVKNRI